MSINANKAATIQGGSNGRVSLAVMKKARIRRQTLAVIDLVSLENLAGSRSESAVELVGKIDALTDVPTNAKLVHPRDNVLVCALDTWQKCRIPLHDRDGFVWVPATTLCGLAKRSATKSGKYRYRTSL